MQQHVSDQQLEQLVTARFTQSITVAETFFHC